MKNTIEPDWANFISMDGDGIECFHEKQPVLVNNRWRSKGRQMLVNGIFNEPSDFKNSVRFTEKTEKKVLDYTKSAFEPENEEEFNRLYLWLEKKIKERNIQLVDLSFEVTGDLVAEYVITGQHESMLIE